MKKTITFFAFVFLSAVTLFAQKADYTKEPGYLDLSGLSAFMSTDKGSEIVVEEGLLKMLSKMAGEKNDDLAKQLSELKLVRMNSFDVEEKNIKEVENKIASIDKELLGRNWDRIARTKSGNEFANVYVKMSGTEKFLGIVITSINSKTNKASFINVVGNIYPEVIGKLAKNLNIPQLGKIRADMKK